MKYLQWVLFFIPTLFIELCGFLLNPLAALFVTTRERTDVVKRLGYKSVTLQRDYLSKYVYWFQTHDNAVDEFWYGLYTEDSFFPYIRNMTQEQYDNSRVNRYLLRVLWLYRNNAYGFLYNLFSKPDRRGDFFTESKYGAKGDSHLWWEFRRYVKSGFQFEGHFPLLPSIFGYRVYQDINVGWKDHRSAIRCLYANRIIGIRIRKSVP